ncbi:alkylated DNA nucleotide flippase Atl1 [Brevibacterium sanguinis]|uniref:Alkylated DNA nucleotide flippase Atl1 n=2 Tax=Brevibacterium TaxID=1696 RepID=A0A366IN87_9MICO|nr:MULTISPECIES: MGMT family protein [Brevibacterium]RBP66295.1 alkylated DNA nucleotide flippase Atl1 [Brevibacterium sanguinis]RBP72946.1 alkylated DNA nucleotide flippase Atl1 [Brevibacterium celere]
MDDVAVERVLRLVELVPPGRVVSYGTIAAVATCSPRYVGRVMREFGRNVSWWRVVGADGVLPAPLLVRACEQWRAEATPHTSAKVLRAAFLTVGELEGLWQEHGRDPADEALGEQLD